MEPVLDGNYEDEIVKRDDDTSESEEEIETSLKNDIILSVLGKIWIQALRTVIIGANFGLIPVVHAEAVTLFVPPKKPPKMRYKDLPIYHSPHAEYKDYLESQNKYPDRNVKLIQKALLPYVRSWRRGFTSTFCAACSSVKSISKSINSSKNDFKKYMRDPSNVQMRQGVVASGTLFGFLLSSGGSLLRRVSFTSLGALATGSLCFPMETDQIFRNVAFGTANLVTAFYNLACRKDIHLSREKVLCKDELPAGAICD